MVDHPAVLAELREPYDKSTPRVTVRDGVPVVTYRRTRFSLDRDGWELLPEDGVLVMRIRPTDGSDEVDLAITADELEAVFGHVRGTASWDQVRRYHRGTLPPVARAFRVGAVSRLAVPAASRSGITPGRPQPSRTTARDEGAGSDPGLSFGAWAAHWYDRFGVRHESPGSLAAVAAWRNAWRPERVRVLLVAESHVAEQPGDEPIRVTASRRLTRDLPERFVRLVYCLGYGESELCRPKPPQNAGTWQFWDIFGQVAFGENQPRASDGTTLAHRLRWKVRVLDALAARGIWLQDASPVGHYVPGGSRIDAGHRREYATMLREGYERYVWPRVAQDRPEQVWVIGTGVARALAGLSGIDPDRVITQPQHRDREQHLAGVARLRAALAQR